MIDPRRRQLFRALWNDGALSRSELHTRTGLTPNGVGVVAEGLLRDGYLRERPASGTGAGRPRVPLEIDPTRRHVIGLALMSDRVEICRLGLSGAVIERHETAVANAATLVSEAAELLAKFRDPRTVGIGVSVSGFVDVSERKLLLHTAEAGQIEADLEPIFEAAGTTPVVLENDMHALAARWLLTHRADEQQDVLLAWIEDGRMGAALLMNGRPNRGCATGANDIGHMRFFVETDRCFCGQTGCLERIVSTEYLKRLDAHYASADSILAGPGPVIDASVPTTLDRRLGAFTVMGRDPALDRVIDYLACGLANLINFIRPHRLVLVSSFMNHAAFADELVVATQSAVLPLLATRVAFDHWNEPAAASAEMAAWLAMAELLCGGWNEANRNPA